MADKDKENNKASNDRGMQAYGILTAVGFELIALVLIAYFLGRWLDKIMGTDGLLMAGMIFLSFGLWIFLLVRALNKIEQDDK